MRFKVGQWVAYRSIGGDRDILGKVISATPDAVKVETRDSCPVGETRTVTFDAESPWWPSPVRWKKQNGRSRWEYAR